MDRHVRVRRLVALDGLIIDEGRELVAQTPHRDQPCEEVDRHDILLEIHCCVEQLDADGQRLRVLVTNDHDLDTRIGALLGKWQ